MSYADISDTQPGQAARQTQAGTEQWQTLVANLTEAITHRVKASMAQEQLARRTHVASQQKRSAAVRAGLMERFAAVARFAVANSHVQGLKTSGKRLTKDASERFEFLRRKASEAIDETVSDVEDGMSAKEELLNQVLEAAALDPQSAAELVQAEMGIEASPDDIDQATSDMADVQIQEEDGVQPEGEEAIKESSARKAKILGVYGQLGPLSQAALRGQAMQKVSMVRRSEAEALAQYQQQEEARRQAAQRQQAQRRQNTRR